MESFGIALQQESIVVIAFMAMTYILIVTGFGSYFARFNKNINDFFYSGNRFSWWLPAASMVATGIGSYSYLKYSEQGYKTGMSSTMIYLNDWFLAPFFLFGWLPIIYYNRIKSVPEYFQKRFNGTARYISLTIILAYMLFYIGYNLYTIGIALEGMFQVPQIYSIPILALFLGSYVTFGGQTAVIFTDLFQGVMLYVAGGIAIFAGIKALGGFDEWWTHLPSSHRLPFVPINQDPKFNTAGLFWGEALAGSIAFTFMNQGFLMRFLSAKSVDEGRKAGFFNVMVTLPISAVIVGALGWIGKSLVMKQAVQGGALSGYEFVEIQNTFHTFIVVCWATVKQNPWIFGFVVSALMAALMSTIDTLINACAAIGVYDLYKPLVRDKASDRHYLKVARWASVITTLVGVLLVIWFNNQKGSLMSIHYKGIMTIIPALVTTLFMGVFWKKFNAPSACLSMVLGSGLTLLSLWQTKLISPLTWFLSGPPEGDYIYFRALFGMISTALIGLTATLLTQKKSKNMNIHGLTIDTMDSAISFYKDGGKPNFKSGKKAKKLTVIIDESIKEAWIQVPKKALELMSAEEGDMLYMGDSRWWLGGLRSCHVKATLLPDKTDKSPKTLQTSDLSPCPNKTEASRIQNQKTQDQKTRNQWKVAMPKSTFDKACLLQGRTITLEKII